MRADQVAVAVGDGQIGTWLGADGELVAKVRLMIIIMPRQMIRMQRGDRDHRRGACQVGRLVAGHLDDPEVVVAADQRILWRHADVAPDQAPVAEPGQQVPGNRRRRTLALGSRHADHLRPVCIDQPQPHPADHGNTEPSEVPHGLAVPRDSRRLDDDITVGERVEAALRCHQQRAAVDVGPGGGVVDEHRLDPPREAGAQVGLALTAQAVETDRAAAQVRPGDRRAHTGPERSVGRAG